MIPPTNVVLLFDIDGVLVEPRGYRAAVQATLEYFTARMGLGQHLLPTEDTISLFEANRITSEWDMVPLSLAILLNSLLAADPNLQLPEHLEGLAGLELGNIPGEIDYRTPIVQLGAVLVPGVHPSETAMRLCEQPELLATHPSAPASRPFLPFLRGSKILRELLASTRDVIHSPTTRIFQHFSLGSQAFSQTYQAPAEFESPSLLSSYDRPTLSSKWLTTLLGGRERGELAWAAYTMRPSLPPREVPGIHYGYAPEAEIALKLAGLSHIPLIGYGHVRYIAELDGVEPESYLKPSPIQALAAILSALSNNELASLVAAKYLVLGLQPVDLTVYKATKPLEIHVFEDTTGGIEAVRNAVDLLVNNGIPARALAWGISSHPEKISALQEASATVFPSLEIALQAAFASIRFNKNLS